jgi:hypothetical protein
VVVMSGDGVVVVMSGDGVVVVVVMSGESVVVVMTGDGVVVGMSGDDVVVMVVMSVDDIVAVSLNDFTVVAADAFVIVVASVDCAVVLTSCDCAVVLSSGDDAVVATIGDCVTVFVWFIYISGSMMLSVLTFPGLSPVTLGAVDSLYLAVDPVQSFGHKVDVRRSRVVALSDVCFRSRGDVVLGMACIVVTSPGCFGVVMFKPETHEGRFLQADL